MRKLVQKRRGVRKISQHSRRDRQWTEVDRPFILNRDEWICQLCGVELFDGPEGNATVDHIVPKAQGGTDDYSNLMAMCKSCNSSKQDKDLTRLTYYAEEWYPQGWPVVRA